MHVGKDTLELAPHFSFVLPLVLVVGQESLVAFLVGHSIPAKPAAGPQQFQRKAEYRLLIGLREMLDRTPYCDYVERFGQRIVLERVAVDVIDITAGVVTHRVPMCGNVVIDTDDSARSARVHVIREKTVSATQI